MKIFEYIKFKFIKSRHLLLILALMLLSKLNAQVIDTVYDDKNDNMATSEKFHHYHILEKENDLIKITGYKKSGKKFMEGHLKSYPDEKTGAFNYYKTNILSETELYEINKYPDIQEKYKDILSYYTEISDSQSLGIKYYKSGKIKYFGFFEKCQLENIWYYFNKKGELSYSVSYHNGKADGEAKFYFNKEPQIIGIYKNGKKNGDWRYYDENFKLIKTVRYVNGRKKEVIYPENE